MLKLFLLLLALFNFNSGTVYENSHIYELHNKKDIIIEDDKPNDEDVGTYSIKDSCDK